LSDDASKSLIRPCSEILTESIEPADIKKRGFRSLNLRAKSIPAAGEKLEDPVIVRKDVSVKFDLESRVINRFTHHFAFSLPERYSDETRSVNDSPNLVEC
jgi:hypothetical protein